jgi:Fe-S-cluster containining protein
MNKFKCYFCGWCCKDLEKYSSQEEYFLAQKLLEKQGIKLHGIKMSTGMILWDKPCAALKMTKDGYRCLIYKQRPYPCRQFLCGKQFKEDNRPFLSNTKFNMKHFTNLLVKYPKFAKIKEKLENKAAKWGNKHGWKLIKLTDKINHV